MDQLGDVVALVRPAELGYVGHLDSQYRCAVKHPHSRALLYQVINAEVT